MTSPAVDLHEMTRLRIAEQARSSARHAVLSLVAHEAARYRTTIAVVVDGLLKNQVSPRFGRDFDEQVRLLGIPRADVLELVLEARDRAQCDLADLRAIVQAYSAGEQPPSVEQANEIVTYAKRTWRGANQHAKSLQKALALVSPDADAEA